MCGIAGVVSTDPRVDERRIHSMIRAIRHRGPDGTGTHVEPHVAFGFCRLAIIDLATGDQPLCNEDGSVWLVFNGEIYNYKELAETLRGRGHVFKSRSDSETIVHAYEEWGDDCVDRLRGMFAFAIWDRRAHRALLARDHSGIKPLYFTSRAGELVFASEAKALLVDQPERRALDLVGYTTRDDLDSTIERTSFRGVSALAPGCVMVRDQSGMRTRRYWSYRPSDAVDGPDATASVVAEFRTELRRSIAEQVMSDVPIGAYLSGGVDSAAVVGWMTQIGCQPRTLTTVNRGVDDEPFARQCVQAFGIEDASFIEYDAQAEIADAIRTIAWMAEGPFDAGYLARYQLARSAASRDIKVVLTGQGIDEILTGYFPGFEAFATNEVARRLLPQGHDHVSGFPPLRADHLRAIHGDASECAAATATGLRHAHAALSRGLLRFEDRMGMAAGVEVRVPLLDHELLALCARLPQRVRAELFDGKALLRRAAAPWVPSEVVHRPKLAFNATLLPLTRLLERTSGGRAMLALLGDDAVRAKGYFDVSTVTDAVARADFRVLDHVLLLHLLDETFVSGFDASAFASPPEVAEVRAVRMEPNGRALQETDIPRLHHGVSGLVAMYAHDAARGSVRRHKVRVEFVERGRAPQILGGDAIALLTLVDGQRSFADIARQIGRAPLDTILAFGTQLVRWNVLTIELTAAA